MGGGGKTHMRATTDDHSAWHLLFGKQWVPRRDSKTFYFNYFNQNMGQTYKSRRYFVERSIKDGTIS